MNSILSKDIEQFVASFPFRNELRDKKVLVTGATGLIGSTLIHCLLALDESIRIIAPIRNKEKMKDMFEEKSRAIDVIECNLETFDYNTIGGVDYIFHFAAPTASKYMVSHPVETANTIYGISDRLLRYASTHKIRGFVFLSSMEVYGSGLDNSIVTEEMQGYLNIQDVRSSYPIAKRAAENLCYLYAKEYAVPVKMARLTQTTGPGVDASDNRMINQFVRLASLKQDIILHSAGESARPSCYTFDCINALFYIVLKGTDGDVYNIANPETYISVRGLAEYIRDNFAPSIRVVIDINDNMGYAAPSKLNLSTAKLEALGWKPQYSLHDIIQRMIEYFKTK